MENKKNPICIYLVNDHAECYPIIMESLLKRYDILYTTAKSQIHDLDMYQPEILVFTVPYPDSSICGMIHLFKEKNPSLSFAVVADSLEKGNISALLFAGCGVCFSGDSDISEIIDSLERLERGIYSYCKTAVRHLKEELSMSSRVTPLLLVRKPNDRELQIAEMILKGNSNQEIARKLYLSVGTIKNIISVIFEKYGFKSRAQIVYLLFYIIKK